MLRRSVSSKVKLFRYRRADAKGRGGTATNLFLASTLHGVVGQLYALAALYPQGKDPQYPLGDWVDLRADLDTRG
jgi:hypothetical protein